MSEIDALLTWLQTKCEEAKKNIKREEEKCENYTEVVSLYGQIAAYREVIAFVQTGGKLR